jgi:hypothetical protein
MLGGDKKRKGALDVLELNESQHMAVDRFELDMRHEHDD